MFNFRHNTSENFFLIKFRIKNALGLVHKQIFLIRGSKTHSFSWLNNFSFTFFAGRIQIELYSLIQAFYSIFESGSGSGSGSAFIGRQIRIRTEPDPDPHKVKVNKDPNLLTVFSNLDPDQNPDPHSLAARSGFVQIRIRIEVNHI
jgi:hypothetical protein